MRVSNLFTPGFSSLNRDTICKTTFTRTYGYVLYRLRLPQFSDQYLVLRRVNGSIRDMRMAPFLLPSRFRKISLLVVNYRFTHLKPPSPFLGLVILGYTWLNDKRPRIFVFLGPDAGPSGLSSCFQLPKTLFVDVDINWSRMVQRWRCFLPSNYTLCS